jgi:arylsulfatase/uncharacterized sulfatase
LALDAGEANALEDEYPVLFQALLNEYLAYAAEMGVIQPNLDSNVKAQITKNMIRKQWGLIGPTFICIIALIVALILGLVYLRRRKTA